jgi:hypothetical protein
LPDESSHSTGPQCFVQPLGLAVDLADPHLRLAVLREVLDECSNSNRSKAEAAAAVNGVKIDTLGLLGTVGTG